MLTHRDLQLLEIPLFQAFSTLYSFTLDINTTHSTWLERVMLIAIFEPQPLLLLVISPRNHLYFEEQVHGKIPENRGISVNRSRAIFATFTVFCVLHMGIGQRDFESRDLFLWEQATLFTGTYTLVQP